VDGNAATHTGTACLDWAGGRIGEGYAIQGNILTGEEVVEAMVTSWQSSTAEPFERRLLAALRAGDAAGGDQRGRQSAALLVVREGAGYGGGDDIAVDLRIDDHPTPVDELARLLDLNDLYLTASTEDEKVAVTPELRRDIDDVLDELGAPDLRSWVGTENFEMRVAEDGSWIDRRVLEILMRLSGRGPTS
jgi:uncharacterized Ntn-hydrolase superfamily protein